MPKIRADQVLEGTGTLDELAEALGVLGVFPQIKSVELSTAQIADLHNTGVVCVPAPGVGKMNLPLGFAGKKLLNSVAFSGSPNINLIYGTDGDVNASPFKAGGQLINAASDKLFVGVPQIDAAVLNVADAENKPLCIKLASSANLDTGPIATYTLATPGTGYLAEDALTLAGGGGDAVVVVDTVDGSGVILTHHLESAGNVYAIANGVGVQSYFGPGTGATFNITGVTEPPVGNGSLSLSVIYISISV